MVASYLLGIVTKIFSTILEYVNSNSRSLTLFAIPKSMLEYSLTDSDSLQFKFPYQVENLHTFDSLISNILIFEVISYLLG